MNVGGNCCSVSPEIQPVLDKWEMADWVKSLCRWDVIAHLTFKWEVSLDAARRGYERFMLRSLPGVSYFFAEEPNPCRDGYHIHALWGGRWLYRREAWAAWFKRFGRARIEPVKGPQDVADYTAKYVTKQDAWWNVKLQWHRSQAMRSAPFTLERDVSPSSALPVPQHEFKFAAGCFNLFSETPASSSALDNRPIVCDPRQGCLWVERSPGLWERSQ